MTEIKHTHVSRAPIEEAQHREDREDLGILPIYPLSVPNVSVVNFGQTVG